MIDVIKVEDCGENIGDYDVLIYKAILIPKNATNGDMIMTLFPEAKIIINKKNMISWMYKGMIKTYPLDWWNSPYKRGETE